MTQLDKGRQQNRAWVGMVAAALALIACVSALFFADVAWASSAAAGTQDAAGAASSAAGSDSASEGPQIRWVPVGLAVLLFIGAGLVAKFGKRR